MKKLLIAGIFLLSTTSILSAQMAITSIQNKVLYLNNREIPIGDTYKSIISEKFKV